MYSNLQNILTSRNILYFFGSTSTLYLIKKLFNRNKTINYKKSSVIFITGCDTGLGYSLAIYCKEILGLHVIATSCNKSFEGAKRLLDKNIYVIELDLLNDSSIVECYNHVCEYLDKNGFELKIIINNAAVMLFGEFDWLPINKITDQINVNLIGPIKLIKLFLNLIFKYNTRIINICSHCSLEVLPGLISYGISKTSLLALTHGLRMELSKYNIDVIGVIPGTFYAQSSIMELQSVYNNVIKENFLQKPKCIQDMYGIYFNNYLQYTSMISTLSINHTDPVIITDPLIMKNIHHAIVDLKPKPLYVCNNEWRYLFYHTLFRWLPVSHIKDSLIMYFMQMPKYQA